MKELISDQNMIQKVNDYTRVAVKNSKTNDKLTISQTLIDYVLVSAEDVGRFHLSFMDDEAIADHRVIGIKCTCNRVNNGSSIKKNIAHTVDLVRYREYKNLYNFDFRMKQWKMKTGTF